MGPPGRSRLVPVLLVALVVAGCGGGGGGGAGDGPARARDELVVAVGEDIWPLTGRGPSSKAFAAGEVNVNVFEPLLSLAPDYTVQPGLAERWELVNPTTWRFHLRPGVRFHDGRPFDADDVVWSWSREFLPDAVTRTLASVTKVDDLTVDFNLSSPNLRLPEQLVHPEGPIVPRNGHNDSTPPVGTGPYQVVEYVPRQRVVVERFDGYWGEKARVRRLTFRFVPEPRVRLEALRSGQADVVADPPAEELTALEADGRFRVARAAPGATQELSFTSRGHPLSELASDVAVRRAMALALDRRAYVTEVLKGNGDAGRWQSPASVLGPAAELVAPPVYDPGLARATLDEAGWRPGPDGVRTRAGLRGPNAGDSRRLTLTLIGGPSAPEAGLRFVQSALAAVGMEVAVKKAYDTVTYRQYQDKGYDVALAAPNQNDANPAFLQTFDDQSGPEATAVASAATREEVQRLAAQISQRRINEEFVVIPLAAVSRTYVLRQGVELRDPHPSAVNQSWTGLAMG